jgi:hypothetical protein
MCAFSLVTQFLKKFGYPCPLWVRVITKLVVIGFLIRLPPMGHVNSKFVLECHRYLLPHYVNGDQSKGVDVWVMLRFPLAHGLGFCGGTNARHRRLIMYVKSL